MTEPFRTQARNGMFDAYCSAHAFDVRRGIRPMKSKFLHFVCVSPYVPMLRRKGGGKKMLQCKMDDWSESDRAW